MAIFTKEEGFRVQSSNLAQWKTVLNEETWNEIVAECNRKNRLLDKHDDGYQVFRGDSIKELVVDISQRKLDEGR